jgi:hypothetical protein
MSLRKVQTISATEGHLRVRANNLEKKNEEAIMKEIFCRLGL